MERREVVDKIVSDIRNRQHEEEIIRSIPVTGPDGSPRDVRDQFMEYTKKVSGSDNPVFYVPAAGPLQIGSTEHLSPGDRAILEALSGSDPIAGLFSLMNGFIQ